jgi:hypothetical protein
MFRSAQDVLGRLHQASVSPPMIDLGGDTTDNGVSKLVRRDRRQLGRYLGDKPPFG